MTNDLTPIHADDGFQRIGWRGFLLMVPASWNLRLFDGNDRQGALFFADLRATRLEFRWRSLPLLTRIRRVDLRDLLQKSARRLRAKSASASDFAELPGGAIRVQIAGATFLLAAVGPRLCELHWPAAAEAPDAPLRDRIAADFLKHASPLHPERFWSVYGAQGWLPKNARLQKTSLLPGETRLAFTHKSTAITLAATSLADRLLAAHGSLRQWAQTLPEMHHLPPGPWHESANAASFTLNHPGWLRRTAHRLELCHDPAANRIAWCHHVSSRFR